MTTYYPIGRERTEEAKRLRHLQGDKGATFANRRIKLLHNGVMGAVTTFATKDNIICEVYEDL